MKIIELKLDDKSLIFNICKNQYLDDYCTVDLLNSDGKITLGSDSFAIIRNRILDALINYVKLEGIGQKDGKEIRWVTTFNDQYFTLYISSSDRTEFHLMDKNAIWIENLILSEQQKKDWINILKKVSTIK